MGCQSEVYIGDDLTFTINTHDPETGEAMDADFAPTYRVYEYETAVPILTGSMAKLDDASTTGFYAETIACTAANGFEHRKSYAIYIEATVDSHPGTISFNFRALGEWVICNGPGDSANTYTTTDSSTGLPLENVEVWVSTDLAGTTVVAYGISNAAGQVTFYLTPGVTYYLWRQLAGYVWANPDTEVAV